MERRAQGRGSSGANEHVLESSRASSCGIASTSPQLTKDQDCSDLVPRVVFGRRVKGVEKRRNSVSYL